MIMVKLTDISFISHTPEPLKGPKSVRDECYKICYLNERQCKGKCMSVEITQDSPWKP